MWAEAGSGGKGEADAPLGALSPDLAGRPLGRLSTNPQALGFNYRKAIGILTIGLYRKVPVPKHRKVPADYIAKCPCITLLTHRRRRLLAPPFADDHRKVPVLPSSAGYRKVPVPSVLTTIAKCPCPSPRRLSQSARARPGLIGEHAIVPVPIGGPVAKEPKVRFSHQRSQTIGDGDAGNDTRSQMCDCCECGIGQHLGSLQLGPQERRGLMT